MSIAIPQLQIRKPQNVKGSATAATVPSHGPAHTQMKTKNGMSDSTSTVETSMAVAARTAFKRAVALEEPVWLVKDLLVAIDAIARSDVNDPYASALTRMVTLGENALKEIELGREEIFHSLHRYGCPDSPLYVGQEGAAA